MIKLKRTVSGCLMIMMSRFDVFSELSIFCRAVCIRRVEFS